MNVGKIYQIGILLLIVGINFEPMVLENSMLRNFYPYEFLPILKDHLNGESEKNITAILG